MKRWTTVLLLAFGGLLPSLAYAQAFHGPPGTYPSGPPPAAFAPGMPMEPQNWSYCPPAAAPNAQTYAELLPEDHVFYNRDAPFALGIKESWARSYVRLDWLLWTISGPEDELVGAANTSGADLSGRDPANRLSAVGPVNGPRQLTSAIVPTLEDGPSQNLSGMRGLWGIPTRMGTFETEAWFLQKVHNDIRIDPFIDTRVAGVPETVIGAVTLLDDGVPDNDTMILFSESYLAQQSTSVFGTEANWIFRPFTENVPLEISPILGFRYIRVNDTLSISGQDIPDPVNNPTQILDHEIASLARNNVFGPQVGLKFASNWGKLDLGAETKFIAGINKLRESVHTEEIYADGEAPVTDSDTRTRFSPVFDLSLYSKWHLTDHFHLYVGYDLLIGGGFSRAYDNIYYNAPTSVADGPAIQLAPKLTKFFAHGLAVGGELVFR